LALEGSVWRKVSAREEPQTEEPEHEFNGSIHKAAGNNSGFELRPRPFMRSQPLQH
jgi:hypothetical protein